MQDTRLIGKGEKHVQIIQGIDAIRLNMQISTGNGRPSSFARGLGNVFDTAAGAGPLLSSI